MKVIGLTGGIGSGKSTAARILAELGAYVIDADRVGHAAYRSGSPGWKSVVDAFGESILARDGEIDRKRLGEVVFADPKQLRRLNEIVHPLIGESIRDDIRARRRAGLRHPIVIEAAVLIEASWTRLADEVWVVVADREQVVKRVRAQRGLDDHAIATRLRAQIDDEERKRHADVVIDNSGTVEALRQSLQRLWSERLPA